MTPPNDFSKARRGAGTKEWSEHSFNVGVGCSHGCRYCYARYNAVTRWKIMKAEDWSRERVKCGIRKITPEKLDGVIMMPTTHDITERYLSEFIIAARGLLEVGNQLLIVSKPHLFCIQQVCAHLGQWRPQIMFRFTIGTMDNRVRQFWEPGAPEIPERLECLIYAHEHGWQTSVSCEPILGGYDAAMAVLAAVEPHVTDTIWFGKMNDIRRRVDCRERDVLVRVQEIEKLQRQDEMLRLYADLQEHPKVKWKDSISRLVKKLEG